MSDYAMKAESVYHEPERQTARYEGEGVQHELERLSKSVAVLQEYAGMLLDILGPVLNPEETAVDRESIHAVPRRSSCPIAEHVRRVSSDVDDIARRLDTTRSRVAL